MSRDDGFPSRLQDVLGEVTGKLKLGDAAATSAVRERWAGAVGAGIAEHSEPTSLRSGVLRVRADSPVWATEIGYLADDIKHKVNAALGGPVVSSVQVWTAPGKPDKGHPGVPRATPAQAPAAHSEELPRDPAEAFARARRAWDERARRRASRRGSENR